MGSPYTGTTASRYVMETASSLPEAPEELMKKLNDTLEIKYDENGKLYSVNKITGEITYPKEMTKEEFANHIYDRVSGNKAAREAQQKAAEEAAAKAQAAAEEKANTPSQVEGTVEGTVDETQSKTQTPTGTQQSKAVTSSKSGPGMASSILHVKGENTVGEGGSTGGVLDTSKNKNKSKTLG